MPADVPLFGESSGTACPCAHSPAATGGGRWDAGGDAAALRLRLLVYAGRAYQVPVAGVSLWACQVGNPGASGCGTGQHGVVSDLLWDEVREWFDPDGHGSLPDVSVAGTTIEAFSHGEHWRLQLT